LFGALGIFFSVGVSFCEVGVSQGSSFFLLYSTLFSVGFVFFGVICLGRLFQWISLGAMGDFRSWVFQFYCALVVPTLRSPFGVSWGWVGYLRFHKVMCSILVGANACSNKEILIVSQWVVVGYRGRIWQWGFVLLPGAIVIQCINP